MRCFSGGVDAALAVGPSVAIACLPSAPFLLLKIHPLLRFLPLLLPRHRLVLLQPTSQLPISWLQHLQLLVWKLLLLQLRCLLFQLQPFLPQCLHPQDATVNYFWPQLHPST